MDYGLYPFWYWNGIENEEEIRRQIYLISGAGCQGVIIRPHVGNGVEYLSRRWMELVRYACEEAAAVGLAIWICDEEGPSSGTAGGLVQQDHSDLVQKCLTFEYGPYDPDEDLYAVFDAVTYKPVKRGAAPGTEVLKFWIDAVPDFVDVFNPEACRRFLLVTHEAYREAVGDYFGTVVQAVYTTGAGYLGDGIDALPWSEWLEDEYSLRNDGEDLREILPFLVEDLPDCETPRLQFYAAALSLFIKNFVTPQRLWAEQNGLAYLGHLGHDEGPLSEAIRSFTDAMSFMRFETIPSMDDFQLDLDDQRYLEHLVNAGRRFMAPAEGEDVARTPLLLYKAASSSAHQFGNNALSCDCLSNLGWARSPGYLDRQMTFEVAMGVNFLSLHGFYYTLGDDAKDLHSPSYFFQQPWFRMAAPLIQRWTESAQLLGRGRYHGPVLLPYPTAFASGLNGEDISSSFQPKRMSRREFTLAEQERALAESVNELTRRHVGFDFFDEYLFSEAHVEDGLLMIGDMAYGMVILPPCVSLLPDTKLLLSSFAMQGGKVLFAEETHVPVPDLMLTGQGTEEVVVHARDLEGDITEFFLVNMGEGDARLSARFPSPLVAYDPISRKIVFQGTSFPFGFTLHPGASIHLLSPGYPAPHIPFFKSSFAPFVTSSEPEFVSGTALNRNILRLADTDTVSFDCEPDVIVRMVYAEHMPETIEINGVPHVASQLRQSRHPCDPCYDGRTIENLVLQGHNEIHLPESCAMVAIGGRFRVAEGNELVAERQINLGDITQQGYPYYWGEIEYRFTFTGEKSLVRLQFVGGGIAEVFVNGTLCGTVANDAIPVYIGDAVQGVKNELVIVYAGFADNFVCGQVIPCGLAGVSCS